MKSEHGENCKSWLWDGCHSWFTIKNFIAQLLLTLFIGSIAFFASYLTAQAETIIVQPDTSADLAGSFVQTFYPNITGTYNQVFWYKEDLGIDKTLGVSFEVYDGVATSSYSSVLGGISNSYGGFISGNVVTSCIYDFNTAATSTGIVMTSDRIRMNGNSYTAAYYGEIYGTAPAGEIAFGLSYNSDCETPAPTSTRIISVTPPNDPDFNDARATSTTFAFGTTGYISDEDYVEGTQIRQRYFNQAGIPSNSFVGPAASGGGQAICNWLPDWLCPPSTDDPIQTSIAGTTYTWDIDSSGSFSYSTTTNVQQVGRYTLVTELFRPSFVGGFALGTDLIVSTTTTFIVATSTRYDVYSDEADANIASLSEAASQASCTVDFSTLFGITDLGDCIIFMFTGSVNAIGNALQAQISDLSSRAPWGYATRVYVIFTASTTPETLPSIAATIPEGLPMSGSSFDFSPWQPIENTVEDLSTRELPGQTGSVLDNFEHWWNTMWLIIFGIWIFRELYETFGGIDLERNPDAYYEAYDQKDWRTRKRVKYRVQGKSPVRFRRTKP